MTKINSKTLSLSPGQRIELYTVDLGIAGGPVLRFTPNREYLVPGQITRVTDTSSGAASRTSMLLGNLPVGARVVFSGFMRSSGSATWFPAFTISPTSVGSSNTYRWRIRLSDLTVSPTSSSPYVGSPAHSVTVAGEWAYFRFSFTVTVAMPTAYITIHPALGLVSGWAATNNAAQGELDLFGLSAYRVEDSMLLPLVADMSFDGPSPWVSASGALVAYADNTYEAIKVPVWQGQAYTPLPIKATGFEKTGNGAFPKPILQMSNLTGVGSLLMQQYGDIRGAEVRRIRLYADNLDNGPDPDPAAAYAPDVFTLVRRSRQDSQMIEFELASKLDQQGVQLPRRQILRDVCPWKYRVWNPDLNGGAGGFDYSKATCPYTGAAMFDMNGAAVTNGAEDECSQSLKLGCRKRYGRDQELPFGGFPMVGRFG